MKLCDYCGRKNQDEAVYCRECGGQKFNDPSKKIQEEAQRSEGDQLAPIELVTSDPRTFAKILRRLSAHQTQLIRAMARVEQLQDVTSKLCLQVSLLKRWRVANTRIIEMLESTLDESIAALSHFDEIGMEQLKALKFAKQYRAKFPGTSDSPDMVAAVARALGRVKENDD